MMFIDSAAVSFISLNCKLQHPTAFTSENKTFTYQDILLKCEWNMKRLEHYIFLTQICIQKLKILFKQKFFGCFYLQNFFCARKQVERNCKQSDLSYAIRIKKKALSQIYATKGVKTNKKLIANENANKLKWRKL